MHYAWVVMGATFVAMLAAAGVNSSFGVYLVPIEAEFLARRADLALIASLGILVNGASQPMVGYMLDRHGARAVAVVCLALAAVGLVASSMVTGLWQLYITYGVVVSAAVAGPSTTMATVVASRWFAKHRGFVVGVLSSAFSAGQVILIPLAMQLSVAYGWRMSYVLLGLLLAVLILPLGLLIRRDPSDMGKQPLGAGDSSARSGSAALEERRTPLSRAVRTHGFWMLAIGFFVCGYSGWGTIATHLVAYSAGRGVDSVTAANALGIIGAASVVGTISIGGIIDRVGRKVPLAMVYFVRGLALLFLVFVDDPLKLTIFAVVFGLGHAATIPPTSSLIAHFFGRLSAGAIFGVIFSIHQVGGALGAYLAGMLFDLTGTYSIGFYISVAFCFVASAASLSITERPVRKPALSKALG